MRLSVGLFCAATNISESFTCVSLPSATGDTVGYCVVCMGIIFLESVIDIAITYALLSQQLIDEIGGHFDQVYVNAYSVCYFGSAEIAF